MNPSEFTKAAPKCAQIERVAASRPSDASRAKRHNRFVPDGTKRKRELLVAKLQRYLDETCPALEARLAATIVGSAPPFLDELVGRLKDLEQ
jgi:hypothetical protein